PSLSRAPSRGRPPPHATQSPCRCGVGDEPAPLPTRLLLMDSTDRTIRSRAATSETSPARKCRVDRPPSPESPSGDAPLRTPSNSQVDLGVGDEPAPLPTRLLLMDSTP